MLFDSFLAKRYKYRVLKEDRKLAVIAYQNTDQASPWFKNFSLIVKIMFLIKWIKIIVQLQ